MSPVQKVRGDCPEDVIIGLDLRRNEDSVGDRWRKCSGGREQHGRRSQGLRIKVQWREKQRPVRLGGGNGGDTVLGRGWAKGVLRKPPLVSGR